MKQHEKTSTTNRFMKNHPTTFKKTNLCCKKQQKTFKKQIFQQNQLKDLQKTQKNKKT